MDRQRKLDVIFEVLEFIRKEARKKYSDWKDADDWIFSNLSITKDELEEVYKDRGLAIYGAACKDKQEDAKKDNYDVYMNYIKDLAKEDVFAQPMCYYAFLQKQKEENLKPCPFCGKSVMVVDSEESGSIPHFSIVCNKNEGGCGSSSGYWHKKADAINNWNRRE